MKPFLISVLAIVALSFGSLYALNQLPFSSEERFSTNNVRLD